MFRYVFIHGATPGFTVAVRKLTEVVLLLERAPTSVELSIHFLRPFQMHALNYEHRGIDKPTDVLTFPGTGSGTPEACWVNEVLLPSADRDKSEINETAAVEGSRAHRRAVLMDLGDIYFSVEYVWIRCLLHPEKNLRFRDYLEAALIHAVLHALGYNHDTPERWRQMSRRERFVANQLATWKRRWPGCWPELNGLDLLDSTKLMV